MILVIHGMYLNKFEYAAAFTFLPPQPVKPNETIPNCTWRFIVRELNILNGTVANKGPPESPLQVSIWFSPPAQMWSWVIVTPASEKTRWQTSRDWWGIFACCKTLVLKPVKKKRINKIFKGNLIRKYMLTVFGTPPAGNCVVLYCITMVVDDLRNGQTNGFNMYWNLEINDNVILSYKRLSHLYLNLPWVFTSRFSFSKATSCVKRGFIYWGWTKISSISYSSGFGKHRRIEELIQSNSVEISCSPKRTLNLQNFTSTKY